jgi:MoxR-like ATPase
MEERQVTVDGVTYVLEAPFIVVATQNPIEMEGTYPLPEAQRDRFMARVSMGYPSSASELAMLSNHGSHSPLADVEPVASAADVRRLIATTREIWVSDAVKQYVVDLANATRAHADLRLGASPRATLHLLRAARAQAALEGRDHVLPDDVQSLAVQVLAHRLLLSPEALLARRSTVDVVASIVQRVPVPSGAAGPGR